MVGNQSSSVAEGRPRQFACDAEPRTPSAARLTAVANLFTRGFCSGKPLIRAQSCAWVA